MTEPLAVSSVLLAAGASRRLGGDEPKQLLELDGQPLVRRIAERALAADLLEVIVVTGYRAPHVARALDGLDVRLVDNRDYEKGQSTSVRAGLAAVSTEADGAVFLPCDQPFLTSEILDRLVAAFRRTCGPIVAPAFLGRRGAPTLFARSLFPALAAITGESGGRQLLPRYGEGLVEVELDDPAPLLDIDTAEDWARLTASAGH